MLGFALPTQQVEAKPRKNRVSKKKKANREFKRALKFVEEQRHEEALASFLKAYDLAPHPLVLFNIAGAHRQLRQYKEALKAYSRFLLEGDGSVKSDLLRRGKKDMDELLALVARVAVDSTPSGATLTMDGEELGTLPLTERLVLAPGPHELQAELDDHEPLERTIRVSPGEELELVLSMVPLAGSEPDAEISPKVSSKTEEGREWRELSVSAAFGSNALRLGTTGAPTIGAAYEISQRVSLGLDVVLIAYSFIPQIRVRLLGDVLSLHAIVAAPLSLSNDDGSSLFAAAAGGAGIRYKLGERVALRAEGLVSYAWKFGVAVPVFAGGELSF